MFCSQCGTQTTATDHARFCEQCGTPFSQRPHAPHASTECGRYNVSADDMRRPTGSVASGSPTARVSRPERNWKAMAISTVFMVLAMIVYNQIFAPVLFPWPDGAFLNWPRITGAGVAGGVFAGIGTLLGQSLTRKRG